MYIRGPNLANVNNVTVELDDDDRSIFFYLQQLVQSVEWGQVKLQIIVYPPAKLSFFFRNLSSMVLNSFFMLSF